MRKLHLILNQPKLGDFLPILHWLMLLLILFIFDAALLWPLILGCYLYYRTVRWAVSADKSEKWVREWGQLMDEGGEYHDVRKDRETRIRRTDAEN